MKPGPAAGRTIAGWRLLHLLGQGAHGSVYLAEKGAARSALKLVPLDSDGDAAAVAADFLRRASAVRRMAHPHVVGIHDAGVEGGIGWLAMELVPGGDLSAHLAPPRLLAPALVLAVTARVAEALAHAHRHGLVHRDLKPANVLVHWPTDTVKLADFGLARLDDAAPTGTGVVPGSPAYMAPELLAGGLPTPQTDLYALGVMLFQLLAGCLPHEAATMGELLRRVATLPAPDLAPLAPGTPPAVCALVAALLAPRPAHRPGDGDDVAARLREAADRLGTAP